MDDLLPGNVLGLDVLLFGRRQEVEEEPGREVVVAGPRGLVSFSITPQIRPRVKQAIVTFLGGALASRFLSSGVEPVSNSYSNTPSE